MYAHKLSKIPPTALERFFFLEMSIFCVILIKFDTLFIERFGIVLVNIAFITNSNESSSFVKKSV